MKRIISLVLTVAMLATLVTLTVPSAMAGAGGIFSFTDGNNITVTAGNAGPVDINLTVQLELPYLATQLGSIEAVMATIYNHENRVEWRDPRCVSAGYGGAFIEGPTTPFSATAGAMSLFPTMVVGGQKVALFTFQLSALPSTTAGWSPGVVRVELSFAGSNPDLAYTLNGDWAHPATVTYSYIDIEIVTVGTHIQVASNPLHVAWSMPSVFPNFVAANTFDTVILDAGTPAPGWVFHNWTTTAAPPAGGVNNSTNPNPSFAFTASPWNEAVTIMANFRPTITIDANGGNGGTPSGVYPLGELTLIPPTHDSLVFGGWMMTGGDWYSWFSDDTTLDVRGVTTLQATWRDPLVRVVSNGAVVFGINPYDSTYGLMSPDVDLFSLTLGASYFVSAGTHPIGLTGTWSASHGTFSNASATETIFTMPSALPLQEDIVLTFTWFLPEPVTLALRPAPGTHAKLAPGRRFTLELYIDNPSELPIGSFNDIDFSFDSNVFEWNLTDNDKDYEYGVNMPFAHGPLLSDGIVGFPSQTGSTLNFNPPEGDEFTEGSALFNFDSQSEGAETSGVLLTINLRVRTDVTYDGSFPFYLSLNALYGIGNDPIHFVYGDLCFIDVIIPVYGDIDGNGSIGSNDVTLLRRYIAVPPEGRAAFIEANPSFNFENAHVTGGENITAADITELRLYIANGGDRARLLQRNPIVLGPK